MSDSFNRHVALVYLTQARAFDGKFRSILVRWARKKWHQYIREIKRNQMELF